MAKKKAGAKPVTTLASGRGLKPVRLDMTPELHRALRIAAAEADKSMAQHARDILSQVLLGGAAEKPKGKGSK